MFVRLVRGTTAMVNTLDSGSSRPGSSPAIHLPLVSVWINLHLLCLSSFGAFPFSFFLNPQPLTPSHAGFFIVTLFYILISRNYRAWLLSSYVCAVSFYRLEDASLANCKLQQSLKIKEEKITELETKYALRILWVFHFFLVVYQSIVSRATQIVVLFIVCFISVKLLSCIGGICFNILVQTEQREVRIICIRETWGVLYPERPGDSES